MLTDILCGDETEKKLWLGHVLPAKKRNRAILVIKI